MSTKNNPGPFDCYANAEPDEPMFVLLARDRHAAALVHLWAAMRRMDPNANVAKIAEAEAVANAMVAYNAHEDQAGVATLARGLAVMAELCGAAVRIEPRPLQPLRMGNWVHEVTVTPRSSPGPDL